MSTALEATTLAASASIYGVIESSDDLVICGEVLGDLHCQATINCKGKITGNVKGRKVILERAWVLGDILCEEIVTDTLSNIQGSVFSKRGSVDCYVRGGVNILSQQHSSERQKTNHDELIAANAV